MDIVAGEATILEVAYRQHSRIRSSRIWVGRATSALLPAALSDTKGHFQTHTLQQSMAVIGSHRAGTEEFRQQIACAIRFRYIVTASTLSHRPSHRAHRR